MSDPFENIKLIIIPKQEPEEEPNETEEQSEEYSEIVEESEEEEPQPSLKKEEKIDSPVNIMNTPQKVPKLIFVVPYRNRPLQQAFFDDHMRNRVLVDYAKDDYLILYAHQKDEREFNRGAMKNIGFLAGKHLFPKDYQNITFVFNDVDTMPYVKNFLNYETTQGNIKHFYGYTFALGGIVSMKGGDFERINGYPNLFSWACEDNELQRRVLNARYNIDRSQFYPIMDIQILQNKDGLQRVVNRGEYDRVLNGTNEGISDILARGDLVYEYHSDTGFVDITQFSTGFWYDRSKDKTHDIRSGTKIFEDNRLLVRKSGRRPVFWGVQSKIDLNTPNRTLNGIPNGKPNDNGAIYRNRNMITNVSRKNR